MHDNSLSMNLKKSLNSERKLITNENTPNAGIQKNKSLHSLIENAPKLNLPSLAAPSQSIQSQREITNQQNQIKIQKSKPLQQSGSDKLQPTEGHS